MHFILDFSLILCKSVTEQTAWTGNKSAGFIWLGFLYFLEQDHLPFVFYNICILSLRKEFNHWFVYLHTLCILQAKSMITVYVQILAWETPSDTYACANFSKDFYATVVIGYNWLIFPCGKWCLHRQIWQNVVTSILPD